MPKQPTKLNTEPAVHGKRRRYTPQQKRALLDDAARPGGSMSTTARKYGVSPSLLFNWKRAMDDATTKSLQANESVVTESEVKWPYPGFVDTWVTLLPQPSEQRRSAAHTLVVPGTRCLSAVASRCRKLRSIPQSSSSQRLG